MIRRLFALAALVATASLTATAQDGPPGAPKPGLPLKTARTHTFTTTKGTWLSLDVSPDGQSIVFDLLGDLYRMPITGGKATQLTSGMAFDAQPRWSPDGKKIVFISDRSGGENVWIMNADGKDTTALTSGNNNQYVSPTYSPDGKYVVVSRSGGTFGTAKLWMFHVEGGQGQQLIRTDAAAAPAAGRGGGGADVLRQMGAAFGPDPRYVWFEQRRGSWIYNTPIEP